MFLFRVKLIITMITSWLLLVILCYFPCIYGELSATSNTTDDVDCYPKDEYFRPGFLYTFKYNTKAVSASVGTSDRVTSVKVQCNIRVQVYEGCHYAMNVSDCSLWELPHPGNDTTQKIEHKNSARFNDELTRYSLSFSMSKGKIHKLWVQDKDPLFSVNIKRGVLSALLIPNVGSPNIKIRSDVQGICPVVYTFTKDVIAMKKNVSDCHFPSRPYVHLSPFSLFWNMSFIQMWWINSTAECEFNIMNGALQTSACRERHAIRLESSYATTTAVQTNVKQSLLFESVARSNLTIPDTSNYRITGILYEYEILRTSNASSEEFLNNVMKNIKDLAVTTIEGVHTYTITLFDDTLTLLRGASAQDLNSFIHKLLSSEGDADINVFQRGFALEALVQCNTDGCIESFVQLFEKMPDSEKPWLYWGNVMISLAISPPASPETIATIAKACMNFRSRQCLLSASSMIHSFWSKIKLSEEKLPESLIEIVKNFSAAIEKGEDEDSLLYIKALRNTGDAAEQAIPDIFDKLKMYFEQKLKGTVWQIAVLEATERLDKSEKRRSWTLAIIKNSSLQTELRAIAFKILAAGWHDSKFEIIRDLRKDLKSEDNMFLDYLGKELDGHPSSFFLQMPFLENRINHFGCERDYWKLFHRNYVQPILQRFNVTTWLFGKSLNIDTTYYSKSEEDEHINDARSFFLQLLTGQKEYRGVGNNEPLEQLALIRRLVNYRQNDVDPKLWFLSNKLFGDELFYMTGNDTNGASLRTTFIELLRQFISGPLPSTRWTSVTRFIDAFNQIPTIVGLPLNWTTNASVAISFTASVSKYMTAEGDSTIQYHISPSAAVTFVNRMVLDIPQFTKIGVQANTTAFTSTDFNVSLETPPGEFTIHVYPPKRRFEIASVFRVNHLIRGDVLEDIPDWDVERVNEKWCTNSSISWSGTALCHEASYANVTDRVKPWTMMAADANWTLFAEFPEKGLKEFKIKFKSSEGKHKGKGQYRIILNSITEKENYEVSVAHDHDWVTGEFETKVQSPKLQYFEIKAKKTVDENGTQTDVNVTILPDMHFSLTYMTEQTKGRRALVTDNRISNGRLLPVLIQQEKFNISTPWSSYSWTQSVQKFPTVFKFDLVYLYHSDLEKGTWLHGILPDIFWEDSQKQASVHLHWDVKRSPSGSGNITYGFCKIPKSIIEISTENVARSAPFQLYTFSTNITKRFLPGYELKTFLNFTYEEGTANGSAGNTFKKANLTVPRFSWAILYNGSQLNHSVIFKKESMVKKSDATIKAQWPGWWHAGVAQNFNIATWNVTLDISLPNTVTDNKCWNVSLNYPQLNSSEIITGNYCWNADGQVEIYSSSNAVRLNGTVMVHNNHSSSSAVRNTLFADGILTHEPSSRTLTYLATFNGDRDNYIDGNVTIELWTTSDYHFSLNKSEIILDGHGRDTWLNISAKSALWSPLNVDLRQIWSLRSESPFFHETMRMIHDWMNIEVEALASNVGKGKTGVVTDANMFHKEFKFYSKTPMFSNTTWKLDSNDSSVTGRMSDLYFVIHSNKDFEKDLDITICQDKLCSGFKTEPERTLLQVKLDIASPWLLKVVTHFNSTLIEEYKRAYVGKIAEVINKAISAMANPNHEMNKLWKPILDGKTIVEFIQEKLANGEIALEQIQENFFEVVSTLEPFYGPTSEVIKRTYASIGYKSFLARFLRESQIGWFWRHFEVGDIIEDWAAKSPELLFKFLFGMQPATDTESGFLLTWEHPSVKWSSLKELPSYSGSVHQSLFSSSNFKAPWALSPVDNFSNRMAAIFGEDMLLTFDGKSFQVPGYTQEKCQYLLAHDFAYDSFSILSTKDSLQIWFSESSGVLIDSKGNSKVVGDIAGAQLTIDGEMIVVKSQHLHVICSNNYYACLIFLDDFMHNKTLGLLGNNNRDPNDDWKTPDGHQTKDIVEFVKSFEVSGIGLCKDRNALDGLQKNMCKGRTKKDSKTCSTFMNETLCADVVPKSVFEDVCATAESCGHGCEIVKAYHFACLARGVPMETKGSCWKCEGDLAVGDPPSRRKDVNLYLLIEKFKFGRDFVRGLEKLVEHLARSFYDARYTSVKVSAFVYSGHDPDTPKIRVNHGKAEDVVALKLLRGLDLTDDVEGDSLGALDALLDMDIFEDKLDANVVLVFASKDLADTKSGATVSGVLGKLQNYGHTSLFSFSNYISGSNIKKVFGVRGDGYAFPQPKRGPEVFVEYPKGNVAKVTSAMRGSVFTASVLEDVLVVPKFITAVADEVTTKVNKEHATKKCKCETAVGLHPTLNCKGD